MSAAMNTDILAGLVVRAFAEARIASKDLHRTVIPAWPSHQRSFPAYLARQLSGADIVDQELGRDLETFLGTLRTRISEATEVCWQADDHHVRGGSEYRRMDEETTGLARCMSNLQAFRNTLSEIHDGARAIRIAEELLEI